MGVNKRKFALAIILNAFVMPGSGHLIIGERLKGILIGALTVFFVLIPLVQYTMTVMNGLRMMSLTSPALERSLGALSGAFETNRGMIYLCILAVLILWLYGIIDILIMKLKADRMADGGIENGM